MIDRTWETWAAREVALMPMRDAGFDPACKGCRIEYESTGNWLGRHTCEGSQGMFRMPPAPKVLPVLTKPQWALLGTMLAKQVPTPKGATREVLHRLMGSGLAMFAGTALECSITPSGRAAHARQTKDGRFVARPLVATETLSGV